MKTDLLFHSLFLVAFIIYGVYHFLDGDTLMTIAFLLLTVAATIRVYQTAENIKKNGE